MDEAIQLMQRRALKDITLTVDQIDGVDTTGDRVLLQRAAVDSIRLACAVQRNPD